MDKHSTLFPLCLLFGGLAGALYVAWLAYLNPNVEYCIGFAVLCIVAAIGYAEKSATDEHNNSFHRDM